MADEQDAFVVHAKGYVIEKSLDPQDCLLIALAARVRLIDVILSLRLKLRYRHAVQLAVIAFAQEPVMEYRNGGVSKCDLSCFDGTAEV